jgi:hypothetical protein
VLIGGASPAVWEFDPARCRKNFARMIIEEYFSEPLKSEIEEYFSDALDETSLDDEFDILAW